MHKERKLFFWQTQKYIKKQIEGILEKAQHSGLIDRASRIMMENILDFTHILVREIMIPRTEINAVSTESTIEEIIQEVIKSRHTRIPVYRNTIDNIVGILNVKDLLVLWKKQISKEDLLKILTKPYYIPETKSTHLLFQELRENKKHIAIVIDEYGGTSGLVTLENLLEEIVGEIHDESDMDEENNGINRAADGSLVVDGRAEIDKLEDCLNINMKTGRYETISGFILDSIKRIPVTGEKFQLAGLEIKIENADERSIKKLKIRKTENNSDEKKPSEH